MIKSSSYLTNLRNALDLLGIISYNLNSTVDSVIVDTF